MRPTPLPLRTTRNQNDVLTQLATELPGITRQVAADDSALRAAGLMRLRDLCELTARFRRPAHRTSRRAVLAAEATFVAWALKDD